MVKKCRARPPFCPNSVETFEEEEELGRQPIVEGRRLIERFWGVMAQGVESGDLVIVQANTYDLGPGRTLLSSRGRWRDTGYLFVRRDPEVASEVYFQDLSWCYENRQEFGHPDFYDKAQMDRDFGWRTGTSAAPAPLKKRSSVSLDNLDDVLKAVFHFDDGFVWRFAEPEERIYHRPGDGYVGVCLEHLRPGLFPRHHVFIKELCKYQYCIPPQQLVPNSIKWISWFLACCSVSGLLPTFKLFHQIFKIQRSNKSPLYELHFRGEELGISTLPVAMRDSLKGWPRELIFVKGGDWENMPIFRTEAVMKFPTLPLEEDALRKVRAFCGSLDHQWTRDSFMKLESMYNFGCKYISIQVLLLLSSYMTCSSLTC